MAQREQVIDDVEPAGALGVVGAADIDEATEGAVGIVAQTMSEA